MTIVTTGHRLGLRTANRRGVGKQGGEAERPERGAAAGAALASTIFEHGASDVDALAQMLFDQARRDYGAAIAAEAQASGFANIRNVRVNDPKVLNGLRERASFAARSIAKTHNKELWQEIQRFGAEMPQANRWAYAKRLETWERNRAGWKANQIAVTELGETMERAKLDFASANAVDARAKVEPGEAACPACEELVGYGWMPLDEAQSLPLPLHVGCVHYLEIEYDRGTMPAQEDLWLGGEPVTL